MVETTALPSYSLKTTGLRKATSSARAPVSASGSSASTAALNASLFIARSLPGRMPVDRAGAEHVSAKRPAENLLGGARGLDQPRQVDPGPDPHLVEHRHEVLRGDVPRRSRGQRAAAELAERRLERLDALLEGREHVREPLPASVVKVGR